MQSPYDGGERESSEDDASATGDEHPLGPERHVLLGSQVVYFALGLPMVCFFVWLAYKFADRGFDAFERRRYPEGILRFGFSFLLGGPGSAFLLLPFGYWLIFEGGLRQLLGT